MSDALLKLVDVSKYYSSQDAVALGLKKVSLEFFSGEFVAVTGESGSGKTTLLNVLSGIDSYEEGEMYFDSQETSGFTVQEWDEYRRNNIAFIFQDYNLIDSYTVLQNVELALYERFTERKARRARALELLDKVGLLSRRRHKCTKLSGGEKQRVAIARALAKDAPIILADEPTGNLDSETSDTILKLIAETSLDKLVIVVTHSFSDISEYATRKIRLFDGSIEEDKTIRKPSRNETSIASIEGGKRSIKNITEIAVKNLFATPRRSIFILTTSFIATLLIAVFLFTFTNMIIPQPDVNMYGERKDTLYTIESNRNSLSDNDVDTLKSIEGVNGVLLNYSAYGMSFVPSKPWQGVRYANDLRMTILTSDNYTNKKPSYGSLPENDNEILLGWSNKGKPDLSLIGKEMELVLLRKYDWYFGDINDDPYYDTMYLKKKYVISGYDTAGNCYLTAAALEALSIEQQQFNTSYVNVSVEGYKDANGNNELYYWFEMNANEFQHDDEIEDDIIYIVYHPALSDFSKSNLYSIIGDAFKVLNAIEINTYFNCGGAYKQYKVLPATPTVNSSIYNKHIGDDYEPAAVVNMELFPGYSAFAKSAALVIFDTTMTQRVIDNIMLHGFKIVYPFSVPMDIPAMIIRIITLFFGGLIGFVILLIAVALISEVYSRISRFKRRDFNILRTVGLPLKVIKGINYAEFLIVSCVAFVFTFISFVTIAIIGSVTESAQLANMVNSLLPFGALHYKAFILYFVVFVFLMLLTMSIARRFNKKMFKSTVKKSLLETA